MQRVYTNHLGGGALWGYFELQSSWGRFECRSVMLVAGQRTAWLPWEKRGDRRQEYWLGHIEDLERNMKSLNYVSDCTTDRKVQ